MSLTLKILLAVDAFFALLLISYLVVKYSTVFNRRPEIYSSEKEQTPVEVSYEEVAVTEKKEPEKPKSQVLEEKQTISIGTFEELEESIKQAKNK